MIKKIFRWIIVLSVVAAQAHCQSNCVQIKKAYGLICYPGQATGVDCTSVTGLASKDYVTNAISGIGTTPSLTAGEIGFGDGSNLLTSDPTFTWDNTNKDFIAAGTIGISLINSANAFYVSQGNAGFWFTGAASTGLLSHQGFGMNFKTNEVYTMGDVGIGNNNYIEINNTASTVKVSTLAGTGTQMVTADINGFLAKQAIPAGTVTSVGYTVTGASFITVTGQPITSSGTIDSKWTGTLGDILYSSATDTWSKLAGYTTANKAFLSQTGTGAVSAVPVWSRLDAGDIASGTLAAGLMPAFSGDVSTSAGNTVTTIGANKVTLAMLATLAANSIIGNNTSSTVTPVALTMAQLRSLMGDTLVIQSADTGITSVALINVRADSVYVAANTQYHITVNGRCGSSGGTGGKFALAIPSGATMDGYAVGNNNTGNAFTGTSNLVSAGESNTICALVSTIAMFTVDAWVSTGATAGFVKFQARTVTSGTFTVYTGVRMERRKAN